MSGHGIGQVFPGRWLGSLAFILLLVAVVAHSISVAGAQTVSLPYSEAEAQAIDRMLMCPVCQGANIEQSGALLARQMQQAVREMLVAGKSREEILTFFVERYGTGALAAPPKAGLNLIAWIVPPATLVAALAAVWLVLRSMTPRRRGEPGEVEVSGESALVEADLEPYLAAVDRELAGSEQGRLSDSTHHRRRSEADG